MSKPEYFTTASPTKSELEAELMDIERLLLLNEANENTIERTRKREELQELQDYLQSEIDRLS